MESNPVVFNELVWLQTLQFHMEKVKYVNFKQVNKSFNDFTCLKCLLYRRLQFHNGSLQQKAFGFI